MSPSAYAAWSKDDLIARIQSLEAVLDQSPKIPPQRIPKPVRPAATSPSASTPSQELPTPSSSKKPKKQPKPFDISAYPRRKIALKFCYMGWEYNGLAYQAEPTPLPMVEAVLLRALADCRLIDPDAGFDGCGWSRCGRTDKGVSAAGQVVSLWARSAIGAKPRTRRPRPTDPLDDDGIPSTEALETPAEPDQEVELRYVNMLNSVLPRSIRVLAWSPVDEGFDARFSCNFRHYKYFFSPGIPPYPFLSPPDGPGTALDLDLMRDAASRLVGDHDFRNFCKIDPSKQVDNYTRRILDVTISPIDSYGNTAPESEASLFVLDLKGTGFLYHQVRHIMAILFLVGSRLEPPSIVNSLLDAQTITRKPIYEMADGLPLVLWDCGYPEGSVAWRVDDKSSTNPQSASNVNSSGGTQSTQNIFYDFDLISKQNSIKTTMSNHFARAATAFHDPPAPPGEQVFRLPLGGGLFLQSGKTKYIDLLDRPRGQRSEDLNERWRAGAGARRKERKEARAAAAVDETVVIGSTDVATDLITNA